MMYLLSFSQEEMKSFPPSSPAIEYGIKLLKENNIQEPNLKTRLALGCFLDKDKEYLMIHDEEQLDKSIEKKYIEAIQELCNNVPLQYITNKQEFMGLEFYVDENVLIPQPDTEILVEEVIKISRGRRFRRPEEKNTNTRPMHRKRSNRNIACKKFGKLQYSTIRHKPKCLKDCK